MAQNDTLRATVARIADMASAALDYRDTSNERPESSGPLRDQQEQTFGCVVKALPFRLLITAAETARTINPTNAPVLGRVDAVGPGFHISEPLRIAVLTSKYWGPGPRRLTVSFMETTPADLKARIVSHLNAWNRTSCIEFVETQGIGHVRISREPGGYWSYLGTDILHVPKSRQTMNLEGFTMSRPEQEYRRVVRHEAGHTLGFPHEHMRKALVARIDPEKAYHWFWETYGWDEATVNQQVLTPLDEASLMGTPPDQTSIMCYQLPGLITKDGEPIAGGTDINDTDYRFAGKIYPRQGQAEAASNEDWPSSDDVKVAAA